MVPSSRFTRSRVDAIPTPACACRQAVKVSMAAGEHQLLTQVVQVLFAARPRGCPGEPRSSAPGRRRSQRREGRASDARTFSRRASGALEWFALDQGLFNDWAALLRVHFFPTKPPTAIALGENRSISGTDWKAESACVPLRHIPRFRNSRFAPPRLAEFHCAPASIPFRVAGSRPVTRRIYGRRDRARRGRRRRVGCRPLSESA
jgi:hypothetical protein